MGHPGLMAAVLVLHPVVSSCSDGPTIDTAAECIESFRAGFEGIENLPGFDVGARGHGSFRDDDWEGRTPMCWVDVDSGGTCHLFALDLEGRWGPSQWRFDVTEPGSCGQGHGQDFEL